mmetsp:Transcript_3269/g.13244  ORF Transcript_3269/g.13244 Transcript_3269/m.13244 type:complete len:212 (-) Transcript_3269:1178-1813(-)
MRRMLLRRTPASIVLAVLHRPLARWPKHGPALSASDFDATAPCDYPLGAGAPSAVSCFTGSFGASACGLCSCCCLPWLCNHTSARRAPTLTIFCSVAVNSLRMIASCAAYLALTPPAPTMPASGDASAATSSTLVSLHMRSCDPGEDGRIASLSVLPLGPEGPAEPLGPAAPATPPPSPSPAFPFAAVAPPASDSFARASARSASMRCPSR